MILDANDVWQFATSDIKGEHANYGLGANYADTAVERCHSLVLMGGTLSPLCTFWRFFKTLQPQQIATFHASAVADPRRVLSFVISKGRQVVYLWNLEFC